MRFFENVEKSHVGWINWNGTVDQYLDVDFLPLGRFFLQPVYSDYELFISACSGRALIVSQEKYIFVIP